MRRHAVIGTLALAMAALVAAVAIGRADTAASALEVNHPGVPPEAPRTDMVRVLTTPAIGAQAREVFATAVVGDHLIVGGNFLQVERPDGTSRRSPQMERLPGLALTLGRAGSCDLVRAERQQT